MSLFSKIIESSQLKKWLVGADSPLEFSRQTVRLNGDITTRSQAAHTKDRLDVANNVVLGLKFWALKRDRESKIFRARKRARKEKNEEELELMALGCHLLEPSSLSSAGLNAMFETNMAFHFFEKVGQNLSCPRVDRDGVVQPLRFEVTINHYDDAMCYKYFAMTRAELHRLFEAWGVRSVFAVAPDIAEYTEGSSSKTKIVFYGILSVPSTVVGLSPAIPLQQIHDGVMDPCLGQSFGG